MLLDGLFRATLDALMTGRLRVTAFVEQTSTATMPVLHYRSHTRRRSSMSTLVLNLPDTQIQVLEHAAQQCGTSIEHLVAELITIIVADETVATTVLLDPLLQSRATMGTGPA